MERAAVLPHERPVDRACSLLSRLARAAPHLPRPAPTHCCPCPLAGILQEQTPAVLEAYSPWFEGFEVQGEDRWALVTARRKA